MPDDYPIRFAAQLRQHFRALRKKHGLTQAQVGALVGVSQARIAEIEANPGLVNFEQLLQLLSALGVTLSLQEDLAASIASDRIQGVKQIGRKKPATLPNRMVTYTQAGIKQPSVFTPDYSVRLSQGNWRTTILRTGPEQSATGALLTPVVHDMETHFSGTPEAKKEKVRSPGTIYSSDSLLNEPRTINPDKGVQAASGRSIRTKKGSW